MKKRIKKLLSLKKFKLKTPRRLSRTFFIFLCTLAIVSPIIYTIFFIPRKTVDAAWYSTSWNKRKKIVVDNSKVSGTTDLTNFPMLISITDGDLKQDAQADGDDILFTSSDGSTKLNHEIERYNNITGELIVWVQIPTLYAVTDTTIYMYYGNSSASSQQSVASTWDTNYKAVYHMNQDPTGTNPSALNSENNTLEGYTNGTRTGDLVEAKIGYGHDFDSADNDRLEMTDNQSGNNITVSGWVNPDSVDANGWQTLIQRSNGVPDYFEFQLYYQARDADIADPGGNDKPVWRIDFDSGKDIDYATEEADGGSILSTGSWYYLVGTYDGTTLAMYKNGTLTESVTCTTCTIPDSSNRITVGYNFAWTSEKLDGRADEVRVSNTARSADWVATEYNNQNSPSTFYTFNGEQNKPNVTSADDPVLYWMFDENNGTTANDTSSSKHNGTITNATWKTDDLCVSGSCMYFDGTGDYVSRAADNDFDFTYSESFTMMAWFRHGAVASGTDVLLARHNTTGTDGGFKIYMESDGDLTCGIDRDSTFGPEDSVTSTAATYDDNQWHHVACVKNGSTSLTLYIDGVSVGTPDTSIVTSGTYANSDTMYVGMDGDGSSNGWIGFIDDVKIYRTARSVDQITTELRKGSGIRGAGQVLGAKEQTALSNGLVGYWKMDETSWTNDCATLSVHDSSGNGNNGALCPNGTGPTGGSLGKYGNGGSFDSVDDKITVADSGSIRLNNGIGPTISAWIKLNNPTTSSGFIVYKDHGYTLEVNNGYLSFYPGGSGYLGAQLEDTTNWQHVLVVMRNETTIEYYINGQYRYTDSQGNGAIPDSTGWDLDIGTSLDGLMDDLRIYNRALSPSEIYNLYNWAPGPLAYWKLDEGSGTTTADSSGNGYTATLTGPPSWDRGKFGNGIKFGANDAYVISNSSIDLQNKSFSLGAWIKRNKNKADGYIGQNVISQGTNSTNAGLGFGIYDDYVRCGFYGNDLDGAYLANKTEWFHIACTYDAVNNIRLVYLNGNLVGKQTGVSADYSGTAGTVKIGGNRWDTNDEFQGNVDDVFIYNYVRTPGQIMEDANGSHPIGGSPIGSQNVYWRFDEGQGTTANSALQNKKNGTLNNFASPATSTSGWTNSGKFNKAIVFDGSNDQVTLGASTDEDVDFTTDPFTLSAWIYMTTAPGSSDNDLIMGKWDASNNQRAYRLVLNNDDSDSTAHLQAEVYDESTDQTLSAATTNDSISPNTWYHVAMTFNGGTTGAAGDLSVFLNGTKMNSNADNASFLGVEDQGSDFTVGDYDSNDVDSSDTAFTGYIDEVQVYNSALTDDQIKILYNSNANLNASTGQVESASTLDGTGNPPIGYWPLDENTGTTTTYDKSGKEYNGTLNGDMKPEAWVRGKYGAALKFDGSNDEVAVSDGAGFSINSYTVNAWVYRTTDSGGNEIIFDNRDGLTDGFRMLVDGANDRFECRYNATDSVSASSLISLNTWYYVTCKSDGSFQYLYVNGILRDSDAITGSIAETTNATIGGLSYGTGSNFPGIIDDVKIYDYARSASQIVYDYNRGRPLGWWKLDENTGTTAYDSSGNGNNGTFTGSGSLTSVAGKFSYGLSFPANSSCMHVDTSNESPFDITSAITISIWIKSSGFQDAWEAFLSKGDSAWRLTRYNQTNNVGFSTTGLSNVDLQGTINVNDGQWHHVVGVYNGANKYIYVDGKLDTSTAATGSISTNSYNVSIGENLETTGRCFYGILDDARVYNYALSAAQIRILYNEDSILRFAPITGNP